MRILVLDTIHGGRRIDGAYASAGHTVDAVDVYRRTTPDAEERAARGGYDLVIAPVHLDPGHPLLFGNTSPVISHHEAVGRLLEDRMPEIFVEVTGAQGKTTTACALASVLPGPGLVHTSMGMFRYPGRSHVGKESIAPASLLSAAAHSGGCRWAVCEVSLGVTGAGSLAIITSDKTYPFAAGKKDALSAKLASASRGGLLLLAPGIRAKGENIIHLEEIATCDWDVCLVEYNGKRYRAANPLFAIPAYRLPLMLAAAAAAICGTDPASLGSFSALPGRMSLAWENGVAIVDNSSSGTNPETSVQATEYARTITGGGYLTLVIGMAEGEGAVCEGFSAADILGAIDRILPSRIIWVGTYPASGSVEHARIHGRVEKICRTLAEARAHAIASTQKGAIVLSVKTWR
jgi:hypothetical protein